MRRFLRQVTSGWLSKAVILAGIFLLSGFISPVTAQNRYAVSRCQDEIRFRVQRDQNQRLRVNFRNVQDYYISASETGVRGRGSADGREFSYQCTINTRFEGLESASYTFGGGDGGTSPPGWLTGTFRGRNPTDRRQVSVTIYGSGEAVAVYDDGRRENGRYYGNNIQFDRGTWEVERSGQSGFRATDNRRTEYFSRIADLPGDYGRVPNWAVGTFIGTTNTGESELTINADGTVTVRSISTNQTFPGVYSDGTLRFDWGVFNLARDGNNVRTTEVNNPNNRTTYRRVR